jgi:hypothetical protein
VNEVDFSYVVTYQVFHLWREPDFEDDWDSGEDVWATNPFCPGEHPGCLACWESGASSDPYELSDDHRAQIELAMIDPVDRPIEGLGEEVQISFPVRFPSKDFVGLSESETLEKVQLLCEEIEIRDPALRRRGFESFGWLVAGVEVFAE